jgi:hypothetical protein
VLVNGKQVDVFDNHVIDHVTTLNLSGNNNVLDIIVENMGRVNYSDFQKDTMNEQRKGADETMQLDKFDIIIILTVVIFPFRFGFSSFIGWPGDSGLGDFPHGMESRIS